MSPGGLTSVACDCGAAVDAVVLLPAGLGVVVVALPEEAVFDGVDDPPHAESTVPAASRAAIATAFRLLT